MKMVHNTEVILVCVFLCMLNNYKAIAMFYLLLFACS